MPRYYYTVKPVWLGKEGKNNVTDLSRVPEDPDPNPSQKDQEKFLLSQLRSK